MTEVMYLYEPRGYTPGYVYRNFDDALAQLLKDEGYKSLDDLSESLGSWWHEFRPEDQYIAIDDGAHIGEIEVR